MNKSIIGHKKKLIVAYCLLYVCLETWWGRSLSQHALRLRRKKILDNLQPNMGSTHTQTHSPDLYMLGLWEETHVNMREHVNST